MDAAGYIPFRTLYSRMAYIFPAGHHHICMPDWLFPESVEWQKSLVNQYTTQYNKLKPELLEARRLDIGIVNARQVEQESRKTLTDLQDKIKVHQKIQDSRYARILQQRELDDKLKEWFRRNTDNYSNTF